MAAENSVTHWIGELQRGNREAAQHLWEKYFGRLVQLAGQKLRGRPLRVADSEDVALSAVHSAFRGIEAGRYPSLGDRDDLWRLLVVITAHKALRLVRNEGRLKRGGNRTLLTQADAPEGEDAAIAEILSREPTPEFALEVAEQCQRLLDDLPDEDLRRIAVWKMEGHLNDEIAAELQCATRTVERKLRLIRSIWEKADATEDKKDKDKH